MHRVSIAATVAVAFAFVGVAAPPAEEKKLFDGKTLEGWKPSGFHGEGEIKVDDGKLVIGAGKPMAGITWKDGKTLPKIDYEIELEAMRVEGKDFFVGLTFPVKDQPCSLILGGWGGSTCGLSSINGADASENETSTQQQFENGRWYKVKLRVTEKKIAAWIDGKELLSIDTTEKDFSIRIEVTRSQPLGFSTYRTTAALRNIVLRKIEAK
ncbi:MAG TPA: DUF1080 domain-containing protein [Planctomycetia bacterium]|nr:DUF1080 domain-containing protein [Planctomycetia bacterium]